MRPSYGFFGRVAAKPVLTAREAAPAAVRKESSLMPASEQAAPKTGRFTVQGEPVVSIQQARDELHWAFYRMQSMQQTCPHLDDEPLMFRWERSPVTGMQVQVIPEATLDELKRREREAKRGVLCTREIRFYRLNEHCGFCGCLALLASIPTHLSNGRRCRAYD